MSPSALTQTAPTQPTPTQPTQTQPTPTPAALKIGGSSRFSAIAIHNGTVHLAGQVSQLENAGITEQSEDVFAKIDALLAQAGTHRAHLLSVQIWLADMADYAAMNEAWDAWLCDGTPPVRVCVEARMAKPHYRIEVLAVAALAPE